MKKRIVSMLVAIIMVFTLLPTVALAGGESDYVSEYDATDHSKEIKYYLAEENLSGDGWSWDAETQILTLNGFQGAGIRFGYDHGLKIVLSEGSANEVNQLMLSSGSDGVVIEGTGELVITHFSKTAYISSITLAEPLQLTGRRSGQVAQWEPLMIDNASVFPVAADGTTSFNKYRISSSGLSTSTTPSTPTAPAAPTFTDVPAWCSDAVNWAVGAEITNGVGNNRFGPGNDCTHAQILTFLYRAERGGGAAAPEDMNKAIDWAREKGMIGADFNSSAKCTRAQAVNYIWQAFGKKDAKASSFPDVDAGADYAKAVDWAVEHGIAEGYTDGTFDPDKVCSRGVIVTLLHRAYVPEVRLTSK